MPLTHPILVGAAKIVQQVIQCLQRNTIIAVIEMVLAGFIILKIFHRDFIVLHQVVNLQLPHLALQEGVVILNIGNVFNIVHL